MKNFLEKLVDEALQETIEEMKNEERNNKDGEITAEEIRKASEPLVELLRKKGHSHMTAVVTDRSVVITEDRLGVPLHYDD